MRKLSLFSLTGFAALGLLASPAQSGTIIQNDLPDFVVMDGETSEVDLSDFFASPSLDLSYEVDGGSVDGSLATVFAADGTFTATANDGEDTAESSGDVSVSNFLVSGLDVDDNNRVVGMDGGNLFLNGLVPGESFSSNAPLAIPEGGAGSPNGGTGAAALIATIGSVETSVDAETGLRVRESSLTQAGTGGEVSADNGLSATLNADGTYSVESTTDFSGTSVVTFGADTGDSADAVHLVAAESSSADLANEGAFAQVPVGDAQADVEFGADGITITADSGEGVLLLQNESITIDGEANISADYEASAVDSLSIAVLGFNGGLGEGDLYYTSTSDLAAGVEKNITTNVMGSMVNPGIQIVNNGDASISVTISSVEVIHAGPIMDYALNPNATADLAVDGSISDVSAWGTDINGQGTGAPTLSDENHYSTPGSAGSLELTTAEATTSTGPQQLGQAYTTATLGQGSFVAEAWATGTEGTLTLFITAGGVSAGGQYTADGEGWSKVVASGINNTADATAFVVLQSAGGAITVDDVSVRVVDENEDDFVDMSLLGL